MGDPIRKDRAGELWDPTQIVVLEAEILAFKDLAVISGGFAWHFMSVPGHKEFKASHDLKDIDILVPKENVGILIARLRHLGHQKIWTRFDGITPGFSRYERFSIEGQKIQIDLFVEDVPSILLENGIRVVEPATLVSFYGVKHNSTHCHAVKAARTLLTQGVSPIGHPSLAPDTDIR